MSHLEAGRWEEKKGRYERRREESGKGGKREGGRGGGNSLKLATKSDQGTGFLGCTAEI